MSDWLGLGGGIVDTGLGLIRDYTNKKWQEQINQQNWEQEQIAASQAYQRQLSIINNYQTPVAQRKLLEQAGLNVGMMYAKGGGGMSGGGASVTKAQGASAEAYKMEANLNIARQTAELENLKAQVENIQADTKNKEIEAANKEKESENWDIINANLQKQIDTEIANVQSETDRNKAQEALYQSEKEAQDLENKFRKETYHYDVENKRLNNKIIEKQIDETEVRIKKMYEEIVNLKVDTKLKNSLMQKAVSEMLLANEQILTTRFERQFSMMMSPVRFNSAIQEYRVRAANLKTKELENARIEILNNPKIVKFDYWNGIATGYISQLIGIGSTVGNIMTGVGMNKLGKARLGLMKEQTTGQIIQNKNNALDYSIKLNQNNNKYNFSTRF